MRDNSPKNLSLLLSLILLSISFFTFGFDEKVYASEESKETGKSINIVHTNDIHGRVKEDKYAGMGMSKVVTKVKELRFKNSNNVLLLDAGDTLHGLPIIGISKGEVMIEIMNKAGYDAMVPGNHDFNYGKDRLMELSKKAEFPIISSNIYNKADGSRWLEPYVVKEVDGVKVGIFGLSTPETAYKTNPRNVEGLEFRNPIEEAKKVSDELRNKEKVDVVIALTHLGLEGKDTSEELAKQVEGIDVIVDGHSHTTLESGKKINNTLIVQSGEYAKNLGIVDLNIIENSGEKQVSSTARLISKEQSSDLQEDVELTNLIKEIEKENGNITSEVVGTTQVFLDGERSNVRTKETNLGNLIADSMVSETGANIAITNGGGIRDSIDKGEITKGDIITVLPFGNYVVTKKVKGKDVLSALELGVSKYPEEKGAFPQVSGIKFKLDPKQSEGNRVHGVMINGKKLELNKSYVLATNDFMAVGGDNYTMFKEYPMLNEYSGVDEVLASYIHDSKNINTGLEERIVVENKAVIDTKILFPEQNTIRSRSAVLIYRLLNVMN